MMNAFGSPDNTNIKQAETAQSQAALAKVDILQYEVQKNGVEALVMSGANPKRAVISFSSMNPGKYERWSWFYERHSEGCEDLYIIFKDDSQHYYLGDSTSSMYIRHIKFINEQLESRGLKAADSYMVGSSMGGYAALYFGFTLGVAGVVSINPQIDYASTRRHSLQNWERQIREIGDTWVDLNDFIYRFEVKPKIHIEHGDYPADVAAVTKFIASLSDLKICYSREFTGGGHSETKINKYRLFDIIDFWSKKHPKI